MDANRAAYDELYAYTMTRGREAFVLQHVVDAQAAQTATRETRPMSVVFALVGLYLHVEKRFSGKHVQQGHMVLARQKREWPTINLPQSRGVMTAADVLEIPAGDERDKAIDRWCEEVWAAYADNRDTVIGVAKEYQLI